MRQKPPPGKPSQGHGGTQNLIDHHGPVMPISVSYAIYWGNQAAFPGDLKTELPVFFNGFGSSTYSDILNQYLRGPGPTLSSFGTAATDTSSPPSRSPSVSTIGNEICKVINSGALPMDPVGVYFAISSNFPKGANFCAYHSFATCDNTIIPIVYLPNTSGVAGCDPGDLFGANNFTEGTRSMANIAAHELSEVITDPRLSAWYDSGGQEVGDKCAWQFLNAVTLGSTNWQLQEEWSNADSGCIQSK
jgi:hypothetical protein